MKNKKVTILLIVVIIVIIALGIGIAISVRNDKLNKASFERDAMATLTYNIALYDGDAKFDYKFNYYKDEIYIVFEQKDTYTKENYYDGGIRINKEKDTIEMYGIEQLRGIEENLTQALKKYVKNYIK